MESNLIILVLCGVVILSYVFELAARKTGIPAVLFLIFLGVGLNRLGEYYLAPAIDFLKLVPVVGTLGLIMIVFEGALEIEYQREKKPLFFRGCWYQWSFLPEPP